MNFETHDRLKREIFADKIDKIITLSNELKDDNCSFVIALDSSWGTGKTTFINMWTNKIISNPKTKVVSYNAWENDDFDKPIISILSDILDSLDDNLAIDAKKKEIKQKAVEITKYIAKKGIPFLLKNQFGFDINEFTTIISETTNGAINSQDVTNVIDILKSKENESLFEEYKNYKETKKRFVELLREISKNEKVIFIIDELDRCNPLYAIEVLETMKHFFNIDNIVFLLAIDIEQLSHSIATVYGQNMDSEGYLKRFFDIQIKLPEPKNLDYIKYILELNNILLTEEMIIELVEITNKLNLSLRDLNRITKNVSVMLKLSDITDYEEDYLLIYIYLMILKYKYPKEFHIVMKKRFLNEGNGSTGSFVVLDDLYFKPTKTIEKFMKSIYNGVMQQKISKLIENNNNCITMMLHLKDKEAKGFDEDIPFYKFIERKLELYY